MHKMRNLIAEMVGRANIEAHKMNLIHSTLVFKVYSNCSFPREFAVRTVVELDTIERLCKTFSCARESARFLFM